MATFVYTNLDHATEERYGELWSWYLEALESGEFETIVQDTRRRRALEQFVSQYVTSYDSNVLILLLPTEDISRSPSLLTSLLSRYYGLTDSGTTTPRTVTITPLGMMKKTQTSVIMVREAHSAHMATVPSFQQSVGMESVFSGEIGYVPSIVNHNTTSHTSVSIHSKTHNGEDEDEDDLKSIDSCSEHSSLSGASLTRVSTIDQSNIDIHSQTAPLITTHTMPSDISYETGEIASQAESRVTSESSGYSLQPFPTMVSTASTLNHRLVLRSMLLRNLSTGETKTAIRQIEDDGMGEDWMLYDDSFSMSNLQLLNLDEVVESGAMCCKFLFYALIADDSHEAESDEEELMEHDLTVVEFDGGLQRDDTYPIRFVQSNTTMATTPLNLSKTNTLRTNHESIKSEMLMHRPDATYSAIQKSKSTPTASSIRKSQRKKKSRHVNTDKCVMM